MYKVLNNISPNFISELFPISNKAFHLREERDFMRPRVNTVLWGTETLRNIGPKIWDMLPQVIKDSSSLNSFKSRIKQWKCHNCPCRLCKTYITGLGFLGN